MVNSLRSLIISVLLIGLFTVAIVNFGHFLAVDNGANQSILNDSLLNRTITNIQSNISEIENDMNDSRTSFDKESILPPLGAFILTSLTTAGKTIVSTITIMYNIIFGFVFTNTQVGVIVMATLSTILVITAIFLAYKFYKTGE